MNNIAYFGFFALALKLTETVPVNWWIICIPFYIVFAVPLFQWYNQQLLAWNIQKINEMIIEHYTNLIKEKSRVNAY